MKAKPPAYIQPEDDLFTLVQSLYIHLNKEQVFTADIIGAVADSSAKVIKFWENAFENSVWKDMRLLCENLEYEELKRHISEM